MTKIISLCSIKCNTLLESQNQRDLEYDDDDDNNNDHDNNINDNDDNNYNNDKNQLKVITSILRALFIKFFIKDILKIVNNVIIDYKTK